ncbi:MAG TPA: sigma factor, partial [Pyrinomonadaceae bacterium]|nr:sigma factor [Pyrinomonadaceae bacterium]
MIKAEAFPTWQTSQCEPPVAGLSATATDYELAQSASTGDISAFELLYERHNRRVYSLCLRMTQNASEAEDLAQE